MRYLFLTMALAFVSPISVFAQTAAVNATQNADPKLSVAQQEVVKLENDWAEAQSRGNVKALEEMLTDDVSLPTGKGFVGKKEFLAGANKRAERLKSNAEKYSESIESVKVQVFGDVAVATGVYVVKYEKDGKTETGRVFFSDVAVKRNGRWQFVSMNSLEEEAPKIAPEPAKKQN